MRAIQSMRSTGKTRLGWAGLKEASSTVLAVRRNRILAITSQRRRIGRDDEDIPVAVERLHTVAGDLERVGVLVVDLGEADLVPALTDGKAAIVEEAAGSRLGEADQRDGLGPAPRAARRGGDELGEVLEGGAGRLEHLGDALGGGPAGAAFAGDALRLVERSRIEAGAFGEARRRTGHSGARARLLPTKLWHG